MTYNEKRNHVALIPIFILLALVPLISHFQLYRTYLETYDWQAADYITDADIFLLVKSYAVCLVAVVMIAFFVGFKLYKEGMKKQTYPLLMYALLVGFSALCSKYKTFALHGIQDQFESVFVLMGYLVITIYCMYCVKQEVDLKWILRFLMLGAAVIAVIGIFQMLRLDFFRSGIGQALILLGSSESSLQFGQPLGRVYATLFNPNYVGAYVCLTLPCALCAGFAAKKKWGKAACFILAAALLVITFGAGAKNGLIALALSLILLLIVYRRKLLAKIKWLVLGCVVFAVVLMGVNAVADNVIVNTMQILYHTLTTTSPTTERTIEDILTKDDEVELVLKDDSLHIKYQILEDDMAVFDLTDNEGTTITYETNDTKIRLLDERFSMIEIEPCVVGETYCFTVYADGLRWDFSNQVNDGTYYFLDWANKFVKLEKADSAVFTNCPSLFSGRGYIWAKTIPLLKKYIFLGAGPDSFQMVFPQYDYVDLAYDFAPNMLITRAHNMYLQMAVQTGVLSLICFLVFYGMYFVKSVKLYIKRKELLDNEPYLFHIGSGLFVASFGYMLSGIVNDSLPVTAPIFWAVIGIGIAVNSILNKKYLVFTQRESPVQFNQEIEMQSVKQTPNQKKKQSRKQRKKGR